MHGCKTEAGCEHAPVPTGVARDPVRLASGLCAASIGYTTLACGQRKVSITFMLASRFISTSRWCTGENSRMLAVPQQGLGWIAGLTPRVCVLVGISVTSEWLITLMVLRQTASRSRHQSILPHAARQTSFKTVCAWQRFARSPPPQASRARCHQWRSCWTCTRPKMRSHHEHSTHRLHT